MKKIIVRYLCGVMLVVSSMSIAMDEEPLMQQNVKKRWYTLGQLKKRLGNWAQRTKFYIKKNLTRDPDMAARAEYNYGRTR